MKYWDQNKGKSFLFFIFAIHNWKKKCFSAIHLFYRMHIHIVWWKTILRSYILIHILKEKIHRNIPHDTIFRDKSHHHYSVLNTVLIRFEKKKNEFFFFFCSKTIRWKSSAWKVDQYFSNNLFSIKTYRDFAPLKFIKKNIRLNFDSHKINRTEGGMRGDCVKMIKNKVVLFVLILFSIGYISCESEIYGFGLGNRQAGWFYIDLLLKALSVYTGKSGFYFILFFFIFFFVFNFFSISVFFNIRWWTDI